ncbi:arylamine N-acetyltransferase family protein [Tieghemostelium lacteum]|uniref:Arylamine N-acetyltransferase family protein n=1 Tax=Tieghemostelium lacteum TaxID=361077 RepID=A0A152A2V9_TIELA|nr:arylamine N-acetyltransferase family protein [Tieghemostelium lacteum]|eukprot:KYR00435.1 arylamine N-acetyltransferase family protein [Tieghemostelium lacteum]
MISYNEETTKEFTAYQILFFKRFNLDVNKYSDQNGRMKIKFEDLAFIMESVAYNAPFENLEVIYGKYKDHVTRETVEDKILVRYSGGLCYQMNTMFYYFLLDCGFNVRMVRASVLNAETLTKRLPHGHVANVIIHQNKSYLIEVGYGNFHAMQPIPINEFTYDNSNNNNNNNTILEQVQSITGQYRTYKKKTHLGSYILEKRRNDDFIVESDKHWNLAYSYYMEDPIQLDQVDQIQNIVLEDQTFAFNKRIMVCQLIKAIGQVVLTAESLTITTFNGEKSKVSFEQNSDTFHQYLLKYFNIILHKLFI